MSISALFISPPIYAGCSIPTFDIGFFIKELSNYTAWSIITIIITNIFLRLIFRKLKDYESIINILSLVLGTAFFYIMITDIVDSSIDIYQDFPFDSYVTELHIWVYTGIFFVVMYLLFQSLLRISSTKHRRNA